jgi:signal transduction histidine kinase
VVTPEELRLLQALAHSTSIALENVDLYSGLEERVAERTRELHSANVELAAKHQALQELQREKEALSALLVHDIRSPAATLIMTGNMRLDRAGLSDTDRCHWQHVVAAGETISRMAENLLDIARAEAGGLAVKPEPLDLAALARGAAEAFAPVAEGRGQAIDLELPDAPVAIAGDRELLRRVLQNLIDNALRYSPHGSRVRVALRAAEGPRVALSVDDSGPGIAPELRSRVFEKYVRLAATRSQHIGRGLGLTFCRLAVEAHGGRIWADASESGGSSFRLELPRRPAG